MVIAGFNKLTLIDYPQKIACIVFFAGCNFRCPFCHNSDIASPCVQSNRAVAGIDKSNDTIDKNNCGNKDSNPDSSGSNPDTNKKSGITPIAQEEIFAHLNKRKGVLEGVVLSGGEPLANNLSDITAFIEKIRESGFKIKLDTNGSYPLKLQTLLDKKLIDYVAMDIKNCPEKYSLTAGVKVNLDDINKSIEIIKNSGVAYEFRTTLVSEFHNESDLEKIALWLKNEKNYFLQGFVNSGRLFDNSLNPLDMGKAAAIVIKHVPDVKIR